jgi:hypothetical protein
VTVGLSFAWAMSLRRAAESGVIAECGSSLPANHANGREWLRGELFHAAR